MTQCSSNSCQFYTISVVLLLLTISSTANAFATTPTRPTLYSSAGGGPSVGVQKVPTINNFISCLKATSDEKAVEGEEEEKKAPTRREKVEAILAKRYPSFYKLLKKNTDVWKSLDDSVGAGGFTIFAPNDDAFKKLGDKKLRQLEDPRNLETVEKIGAYHVISIEAVSADRLFREDWTVPKSPDGNPALSIGAVLTLGGEVKVGRAKSGGFLGIGGKEDGSVTIGPNAKIVQSFRGGGKGDCWYLHEVDALVSPDILWRYLDQLRIPGT